MGRRGRTGDVLRDVTASGLEKSVLAADVAAGDDTGTTDERGTDLRTAGGEEGSKGQSLSRVVKGEA